MEKYLQIPSTKIVKVKMEQLDELPAIKEINLPQAGTKNTHTEDKQITVTPDKTLSDAPSTDNNEPICLQYE